MNLFRTIVAAGLVASGSAMAAPYAIDDDHSAVIFKANHLGFSHTYGRFNDISGTFQWDSAAPTAGNLSVTIKADSIDSDHEKRDQHLRNPDFFNAAQFPVITFESSSIADKGNGVYAVTGTLSLHGVSKEITVDLEKVGEGTDPWGGYRAGFHTSFSINRSDFGMTYMADGIADEIGLTISLEGIRQ